MFSFSKLRRKRPYIIAEKETMQFDAVNMDINNTCNQRCRFCFTYFGDKPTYMDLKTFNAMIKVLPYVRDYTSKGYGFYISCVYEPTLNPQFLELLSVLPPIGKNKCFFTTNLSKPMTDEYIKEMINSNVALINISIESLKSDKYHYITKSKNFKHYNNNLMLLEKILKENNGEIPKFRFITMLLKENKDEIIDLIEYTNTHFDIQSHEVRSPYISIYENMEWNREQLLSESDAKKFRDEINALPYSVALSIESIEDLKTYDCQTKNEENANEDMYAVAREKFKKVEDYEYLFLRINPDGTCEDKITNTPEKIPIDDSEEFFKNKLKQLYVNKANASYCNEFNEKESSGDAFIFIDSLTENDVYVKLKGWCCPDRSVNINKLIIRLKGQGDEVHYYHTSTRERFDADEYKQKEKGWCGGFITYIDKSNLKGKKYTVDLIYKNCNDENISYTYEKDISLL